MSGPRHRLASTGTWSGSSRSRPPRRLDAAIETAPALAGLYVDVFGEHQEMFRRGALLACFPDLDQSAAGEFTDGAHARVRRDFVRRD